MGKQTKKKGNETGAEQTPPIFKRAKRIKTIEDAKNLLSRLISALIKRDITGREAKDLCYLLSSYITIYRDHNLEKRLEAIEKKLS